jgi:hypothetical protein
MLEIDSEGLQVVEVAVGYWVVRGQYADSTYQQRGGIGSGGCSAVVVWNNHSGLHLQLRLGSNCADAGGVVVVSSYLGLG